MKNSKAARFIASATAFAAMAGLGTSAHASTVYDWTGGSITLTATNGNNGNSLLSPVSQRLNLDSLSQVTLSGSPTPTSIPSFEFSDTGPTSLTLGGALTGDTLVLSDFILAPSTNYGSSVVGSGPTDGFSLTGIKDSGTFEVFNASHQVVVGPTTFSKNFGSALTGSVSISGAGLNIVLDGVQLGTVTVKGVPVELKGDLNFTGGFTPVPIPAAAWLLGSGLLGLGIGARRRRVAAA